MESYTLHEDGICQVRVPLPFPLRWVNGYLLPDARGWILIDPGLHTEDAIRVWEEVFTALDLQPTAIHAIVLTHHHPDHYGLAGWMQQRTGAPVYMADKGRVQAERLWGVDSPAYTAQLLERFRQHGLPAELQVPMQSHLREFVTLVSPQPAVQRIVPGQTVYFTDESYEVMEGNGHAYGHLLFYQREKRRILCGDHVMPHISPNVSYLPQVDEDPLASYLDSLRTLQALPVERAFPGHREPFANWAARIGQLLHHHEQRLQWFCQYLSDRRSAYETCIALFGERLSIHQLRFALSETVAHLIFLQNERKIEAVEQSEHPATYTYRRIRDDNNGIYRL